MSKKARELFDAAEPAYTTTKIGQIRDALNDGRSPWIAANKDREVYVYAGMPTKSKKGEYWRGHAIVFVGDLEEVPEDWKTQRFVINTAFFRDGE